jgi:hypothetical protein
LRSRLTFLAVPINMPGSWVGVMSALGVFLEWELGVFPAALGVIIAYWLLTGKISMRGLLSDKSGAGTISSGRIQLLVSTLGLAAYYLSQVANIAHSATGQPGLPDFPADWLLVLGGSHSIYLGGKAIPLIQRLMNKVQDK